MALAGRYLPTQQPQQGKAGADHGGAAAEPVKPPVAPCHAAVPGGQERPDAAGNTADQQPGCRAQEGAPREVPDGGAQPSRQDLLRNRQCQWNQPEPLVDDHDGEGPLVGFRRQRTVAPARADADAVPQKRNDQSDHAARSWAGTRTE